MRAWARGLVADKDSGALRAASEGAGSSQLNFSARCARDFFLSGEGLGPRRRHRQRFWRPACGVGGRRVVTVKNLGALRARFFFIWRGPGARGVVSDKDSGACVRRRRAQGRHSLIFRRAARATLFFFYLARAWSQRPRHRYRFWRPACGVGGAGEQFQSTANFNF